jgi:hypothetical protein
MVMLLPAVVKPVVILIKQHQRLHAVPGDTVLITSIIILLFWVFIIVRAVICGVVQRKMIDFYYSDKSGWDTHQQSMFEAYPQLGAFNMVFKFWVWPISNFYPEYKRDNHEKSI